MKTNKPIHNPDETVVPAETIAEAEQPITHNTQPVTSSVDRAMEDKEQDMEVHHHTHASHGKKNWKSYFWEFLMLFLAVFCGFFAEYQLEHQIERDREKQFIKTMVEDLKTDTSELNDLIKVRKERIRELDTLFSLIASDEYVMNGKKLYELYDLPYWDVLRFFSIGQNDATTEEWRQPSFNTQNECVQCNHKI